MNTNSMEELMSRLAKEREEVAIKSKNQLFDLALQMREMGITRVEITFDGSGDSGQIDEVEIYPKSLDSNYKDIENSLEEWAYEFLEGTGVDWYNNEGGFGNINIDVSEGKYTYEVNQRVETYELAASGEEEI